MKPDVIGALPNNSAETARVTITVGADVRNKPDEATRVPEARMGMIDPARFFNRQNFERLPGAGQAGAV